MTFYNSHDLCWEDPSDGGWGGCVLVCLVPWNQCVPEIDNQISKEKKWSFVFWLSTAYDIYNDIVTWPFLVLLFVIGFFFFSVRVCFEQTVLLHLRWISSHAGGEADDVQISSLLPITFWMGASQHHALCSVLLFSSIPHLFPQGLNRVHMQRR